MPGFLVHVGAKATCSHGGQVTFSTANTRVLVSGQPVITRPDLYTVAGCPFQAGNKPQPCFTGRWLTASTRILINGQPAVLQSGTGQCHSGQCESAEKIPQGPPTVSGIQTRASGL